MCNNFIRLVDYIYNKTPLNIIAYSHPSLDNKLIDAQYVEIERHIHDSIVVISEKRLLTKSSAIIFILKKAKNRTANLAASIMIFVPTKLLDFIYSIMAKNRRSFNTKLALWPKNCILKKPKNIRIIQ